jgi:homospermidine synthase
MIIFSGLGLLVPLIVLVCVWIGSAICGQQYWKAHPGAASAALMVAAALVTALGWWLRNRPGRVVIDKQSGREVTLRRSHSLFFIPVVYWGPLIGLYALYYLLAR